MSRPRLAIFPWGAVFEEYLDPLGIPLEAFRTTVSGGWIFNYVRALRVAGIESTIVLISRDARSIEWSVHEPTGAGFCVLPASRRLRAATRLMERRQHRRTGAGGGIVTGSTVERSERREPAIRTVKRWLGVQMTDVIRYGTTALGPIAGLLRDGRFDGVLCQEYEDVRFDMLVALGRRAGVPVFASFQGAVAPRGILERSIRRRTIPASAGLIIGAAREAQRVQAQYGLPEGHIGVIRNPIALEEVPRHRPGRDPRAARNCS
jgi:hypothetical protein